MVRPPLAPGFLAALALALAVPPFAAAAAAAQQPPAPPARPAAPDTARRPAPRDSAGAAARPDSAAELEGVTVSATRGARRVDAEPTRVDVLDAEEVEEKTLMTPGSAAMLLAETGGVRVAATSPALGGANVRVQGLRGRYTQLLADGLPLYGLSADGLGLLQVPPVYLARVELIRGAASALYGPAAMGGVVNFVSRRPPAEGAAGDLLVNQTTLDGSDLALWGGRAFGRGWGATVLASASRQRRRDLDRDGWADVPGYGRAVLRPRVTRAGPRGDLFATAGLTAEDRAGGTVLGGRLRPTGLPFAQSRATRRADAGVVARAYGAGGRVLAVRASATGEWRRQAAGGARERGRRTALFAEAALTLPAGAEQEFVVGAAAQRDAYAPRAAPGDALSSLGPGYAFAVPALFAQHTWTPGGAAGRFGVTSSGRLDVHSRYGRLVSPRVSAVVRPGGGVTARLSGGLGTFAPTPFVEEAEEPGVARVLGFGQLGPERARNSQADVGWARGPLEVNAAVYAAAVRGAVLARGAPDPLADPVPGDALGSGAYLLLVNAGRPTRTAGAQLFARVRAGPYRVTATYERQRATEDDPERPGRRRGVPLTPRSAAGLVAAWERENGDGVGVEAYHTGRQALADDPYRASGRPFVTVGVLARRRVGRALLFVNGENLGDVRQTRTAPLVRPAPGPGGRWTTDAWAPLEGAVVNAGVRVTLGGDGA